MGAAVRTQLKKVIVTSASSSIKAMPMRLGGVPMGVRSPPDARAVGDHKHQRGAEPEPAYVPVGVGLLLHHPAQSAHHPEPDGEEHRGGCGVRDKGADGGRDRAEGDDDAVGRAGDARDGEHKEGEPAVEAVGDHGLSDDESPDKEEDDRVHERAEDDVAGCVVGVRSEGGHVEDHAERQRQDRRHRYRDGLGEPVDYGKGEYGGQGMLALVQR